MIELKHLFYIPYAGYNQYHQDNSDDLEKSLKIMLDGKIFSWFVIVPQK